MAAPKARAAAGGMRALVRRVGAVVIASLFVVGDVAPAPTVVPGANGRIAYTSSTTTIGDPGIYLVRAGGGGRQVSISAGQDPVWSPDGRRIAFTRFVTGGGLAARVYVAKPDGSEQTEVTRGGFDRSPTWSPDGTRIAFARGVNEAELWVTNAAGGEPRPLTSVASTLRNVSQPDWSPDGRWIVFTAWEIGSQGDTRIFLVDAEGQGLRSLTPSDGVADYAPSWSPDGARIAFFSDSGTASGAGVPSWGLEIMNADGGGRARLATISDLRCPCEIPRLDPSWSPDNRQIAYAADRNGNRDIYVINADGSGERRLTSDAAIDSAPTWQPAVDLTVSQRARPTRPRSGDVVRSAIVVRNVARRAGNAVRVTGSVAGSSRVTVSSSRGRCSSGRVFRCELGALGVGQSAVVNVRVRTVRVGSLAFTAAATSTEAEATEANNRSSIRIRVVRR